MRNLKLRSIRHIRFGTWRHYARVTPLEVATDLGHVQMRAKLF